uniref:Uncharacterized protein n=1 Tax=Steinernema glaseri TaxID=37863 RepID=A0A1I7YFC1_9BILA
MSESKFDLDTQPMEFINDVQLVETDFKTDRHSKHSDHPICYPLSDPVSGHSNIPCQPVLLTAFSVEFERFCGRGNCNLLRAVFNEIFIWKSVRTPCSVTSQL